MNNLGLVGVIMIFYKNSLFLILLLSALYLSGCEKTQNNGSILYYEQNKFEVDIIVIITIFIIELMEILSFIQSSK